MTMNWAIYQSFARIPLGVAVTIEFLGPLTVAVIGSRRPRDLIWVVLAGPGVALLGFSPAGLTLGGRRCSRCSRARRWAAYILLSAQTGRRWPGLSGLASPAWSAPSCWRRRRSRGRAALLEPAGAAARVWPSGCSPR